jgi:hypothetical protein
MDPAGQLDDLVSMRFDGGGEPGLHLDVTAEPAGG